MSLFGAVLDAGSFSARFAAGLGTGAASWAAAGALGGWAGRACLQRLGPQERPLFAAVTGYVLVGSSVAVLALFHALSATSLTLIIVAALAFALPGIRFWPRRVYDIAARFRAASVAVKAAWFVTGGAWLTAAIAAALPVVDWDPLAYHLPIAAAALARGAFVFDPNLAQSAFPLLGEAAALPAFAIAGSAGATFATLGAGIALSLLAGALAERVRTGSGPLCCALLASSSLWLWLAPAFYVDVPFALVALAALGLAATTDHVETRTAALIGFFAGAAAAIKYPGVPVAALAIIVVAWRCVPSLRWRAVAASLAACATVAGGWYVRAYALTGDPVYPFASGMLGRGHVVRDFAARYISMTRDWCGGHATIGDFLVLPWRLLTEPQMFCGDQGYALRLAAVLFAAAFFVTRARILVALTVALVALWFWTSRQWRFLVTALSIYSIAATTGLDTIAERIRPAITAALLVLAATSVVLNWLPRAGRDASNSLAPGFAYMMGEQDGRQYLSNRLEGYDAGEWAFARLASGARVALLDDVRSYYVGPAAIELNPYYQAQWRLDWAAAPAARYASLRTNRVAFMIVDANRAYLARTPVDVDWSKLAADERAGAIRRVFAAHDVIVYALDRAAALR